MIVDGVGELIADAVPSVSLNMNAIVNNLKYVNQRQCFEGRKIKGMKKEE
jgi:hypothetical protein